MISAFGRRAGCLITHRGVSGPAVLRLTAFAARALHASRYQGELRVDWSGGLGRERVQQRLQQARLEQARRTLVAAKPFEHLPRRLWLAFLTQAGVDAERRWADLPAKAERTVGGDPLRSAFIDPGPRPVRGRVCDRWWR